MNSKPSCKAGTFPSFMRDDSFPRKEVPFGCVELPLATSAEIWSYTPIGTLVSIET